PTGIIGMSDPTRIAQFVNSSCPRWDPAAHGPEEYCNTIFHGREWERPVSMEYLDPAGFQVFQLDAGIRVHGSDYTRPRLCRNSKFSYRLYFRGDYGVPQLTESIIPRSMLPEWDKLVARGGLDDRINPFMRDELLRRCWIDMGHVGVQGTFVHLFVNGAYVGYYNICERPDQQFFQTWYNDSSTEWDVIKRRGDITDGDSVAWDALLAQAPLGPQPAEDRYDELEPLMDIENFADYILLNAYAATWDWPENNWVAYRPRVEGGKFKFTCWDAEGAFGYDGQGLNYHLFLQDLYRVRNDDNEIPRIFRALIGSATFKQILEYRASLHFFGNGALTDENLMIRYQEIADILAPVIPNFDNLPNNDFPDLDDDFSIGNYWIPNRRPFFLAQLAGFDIEPMPLPTPTFTSTPDVTSTPTVTLTSTPEPTATFTFTPVATSTPNTDLNGDGDVNAIDLL
ncbi:MAG: CotH kinase family protein, partial [Candidatus Omnitrophica bacterium]|nr:CotH kinase family protein [Candidatus Omnitrophota bacterium]